MDRTGSILKNLLDKPGEWLVIRKKKTKGVQGTKKENAAERRRTFEELKTALGVMSIPFEVSEETRYKIRVVHPDKQDRSNYEMVQLRSAQPNWYGHSM